LGGLRRVEQIMGMPIMIDVRDREIGPELLDRAFDWFRFVDNTFSTYKSESEISRLNRGELSMDDVHPHVRTVLARCEELREETRGYFDVRAARMYGSQATVTGLPIDPSGLVKGWSVDQAGAILDQAGARNYYINAGGDVRIRGRSGPGSEWRIGIQHPYLRDQIAAVVVAGDLAIATSGAYERGQHIIDPHTGQPPGGVLSVTIVGPDLATADAYATAAFAMGRNGPPWTARLTGYEAMTILDDDTVLYTPAFPSA
jgi:thiamine biosynthesis lipoprotein